MTNQEVLDSDKKSLILLAQIRNAVSEILDSEEWSYTFIDNIVNVADFTHYLVSDRYFMEFYKAEDLLVFIHSPWKYYNEINLCKMYDLVLEKAVGSPFERVENLNKSFIRSIKWAFEDFSYKDICPEDIPTYIDEEVADELLECIDYYEDEIAKETN